MQKPLYSTTHISSAKPGPPLLIVETGLSILKLDSHDWHKTRLLTAAQWPAILPHTHCDNVILPVWYCLMRDLFPFCFCHTLHAATPCCLLSEWTDRILDPHSNVYVTFCVLSYSMYLFIVQKTTVPGLHDVMRSHIPVDNDAFTSKTDYFIALDYSQYMILILYNSLQFCAIHESKWPLSIHSCVCVCATCVHKFSNMELTV